MYSRLLRLGLIFTLLHPAMLLAQVTAEFPKDNAQVFDVRVNLTPDAYFQVEPVSYYNGNQPYHLNNYGAQTDFNRAFIKAWRWGSVKLYTDSALTQRYRFRAFKRDFPRYKRLKKRRFWSQEDTVLYDLQIEILRDLTYRFNPGYASFSDRGFKIGIHEYNPPSVKLPIERSLELFVAEADLLKILDEMAVRRAYDGILEHAPRDMLLTQSCAFTVEACRGCSIDSFLTKLNTSVLRRGALLFSQNWPDVQTKAPVWYRTPFVFKTARYKDEGLHDVLQQQYDNSKTHIAILREYIAEPLLEEILKQEIEIYQTGELERPLDIEIVYNYIENHPAVLSRPTKTTVEKADFSVGLQDIEVGGTLTRRTKKDAILSTTFTPQFIALGWNAYGDAAASASLGVVRIEDAAKVIGEIDGLSLADWLQDHHRLAYPVQVHKSYPPSASQAMLLNLYLSLKPWDALPPPYALFGEADQAALKAKFEALIEQMR